MAREVGHPKNGSIFGANVSAVFRYVLRHEIVARKTIRTSMDNLIRETEFLEDAEFDWFNGCYHYMQPEYYTGELQIKRINKKHRYSIFSKEILITELKEADAQGVEALEKVYLKHALEVLIAVGKKYKLPYQKFEEMLLECA